MRGVAHMKRHGVFKVSHAFGFGIGMNVTVRVRFLFMFIFTQQKHVLFPVERFENAIHAELFAVGVHRFGEAVGEEQNAVALMKFDGFDFQQFGKFRRADDAKCEAIRRQNVDIFFGMSDE